MNIYRQPFQGDYQITQPYGATDGTDPDGHTGIDYGCPAGTPILASGDGIVLYAQYNTYGYGNEVIILHEAKKATVYAHLSEITVYMNQKVRRGDAIGLSGSTGNSTGPHLHFEARSVWYDPKTHQDPVTYLPLTNVFDTERKSLKNADQFQPEDLLTVTAPAGCKAFTNPDFSDFSVCPLGTKFRYTGQSVVRPDNGLTYMQVIPEPVWIAVHDNDCQILDKGD